MSFHQFYFEKKPFYEEQVIKTDAKNTEYIRQHLRLPMGQKKSRKVLTYYKDGPYTVPIAEILSGKNVRAWVSMFFT